MTWVWKAMVALTIAAAIAIIARRIGRFIATGGRSACDNCPYSGQCSSPKAKGRPGKCKRRSRQ